MGQDQLPQEALLATTQGAFHKHAATAAPLTLSAPPRTTSPSALDTAMANELAQAQQSGKLMYIPV